MKQRINTLVVWLMLVSLLIALPMSLPAAPTVGIEYEVWMEEPHTHYFDVAMTVTGLERETMDLVMPVWTPGSYLIRDYARHVIAVSAADGSGAPRQVKKISKNVWRIQSNQAAKMTVRYRVYAFNDNMRENYLDESHAYINGAGLFMYVDGFIRHPVRLKIHPAPGWDTISTGLDPVANEAWTFQAPDYDVLADCPIEIGRHKVYEFTVRGVPHRIAIYGVGNYDPVRLVEETRRIVEAAVALFGEMPYTHYTFIVHLTHRGSSGIEHANSASLDFPRRGFEPEATSLGWLSLVAHEFFHLWNVKRIRPRELGPFDYTKENYTRMLWVAEGFTSYYADRLLRQAGFISEEGYLQRLADDIAELQSRPGRQVQSVAEASFDAWIKFYRPNENSINTTVSYYTKGGVLAALLDLEIRHRTLSARSLDDVMRTLYQEFYKQRNVGYTEEEFRQVCERMAGGDLSEFFDRYIYGTVEIEYDRFFNYAGLRLIPVDNHDETGYLGVQVRNTGGKVIVAAVIADTPAYRYGVYAGDEIMAMDGLRVRFDDFAERLRAKKAGGPVTLTLARDGIVHTVDVVLGQRPVTEYWIQKVDKPTAEQEAVYRGWVSAANAVGAPSGVSRIAERSVTLVK